VSLGCARAAVPQTARKAEPAAYRKKRERQYILSHVRLLKVSYSGARCGRLSYAPELGPHTRAVCLRAAKMISCDELASS
jgi:hypothetical protein